MTLNKDFVFEKTKEDFRKINWFDKLRSTFLIYFMFGFVITWFTGVTLLVAKTMGEYTVVMTIIWIVVIAILWIKLFKHYELKSPFCRKIYLYRLVMALSEVEKTVGIIVLKIKKRKRTIKAKIIIRKIDKAVTINYTNNYKVNIRGIIPGTQMALPQIDKLDPKTWVFSISGESRFFKEDDLEFEFTHKSDQKDLVVEKKIELFDFIEKSVVEKYSEDQVKFIKKINDALEGTALSGNIRFRNEMYKITIYDNIRTINRYKPPVVDYKTDGLHKTLALQGVPIESVAFLGLNKLVELF